MPTKIEWAEETWNPVTGCSPISEGCRNCYAERMSKRLAGRCGYPEDEPFRVTLHSDRLDEPLKWKKPRKVFVCSMGDLFHEDVPDEWIDQLVWEIGHTFQKHTFLVLTKRPERMRAWFVKAYKENLPYPNIWLGVTAENQQRADERIPILLQIPASLRFVSIEPMLGPVDLTRIIYDRQTVIDSLEGLHGWPLPHAEGPKLDWVICGGETGPGARPMHPDWVRSLRDQCQAARTPFFFKSWGDWVSPSQMPGETYRRIEDFGDGIGITDNPRKVGKKAAGRLLDGQEWNQYPG